MLKNKLRGWLILTWLGFAPPGMADLIDSLEDTAPQEEVRKQPETGPQTQGEDKPRSSQEKAAGGSSHSPKEPETRESGKEVSGKSPVNPASPKADSAGQGNTGGQPPRPGKAQGGKDTGKSEAGNKGAPLRKEREPVNFEGDELSGFRSLGMVELQNNVRVRQGDFYLQSQQAKVFFDQKTDDVKKVEAHGKVRMTKKDPKTGETIRAHSEKVEFDALTEKVTLLGKATLYRGKDVINGEVIYYDLKTGWLKASKVKGVVQPEEQP